MTRIRPERSGDAEAIHTLLLACFETDSEATLVDALRAAGNLRVSLVAEYEDRIIGHVAFSPAQSADGALGAGLAPLAVAAEHRREGLGARLVEAGIEACRAAGFGWVVVLGEPEYYERFGFEAAPKAGMVDEYGGGDAFQVLELRAGALPAPGVVRYAPEFALFA